MRRSGFARSLGTGALNLQTLAALEMGAFDVRVKLVERLKRPLPRTPTQLSPLQAARD